MKQNYIKSNDENLILMKNIEDKEKRHECYDVMIHKDITKLDNKKTLGSIRN